VSKRCGFGALLAGLVVVGGATFARAQALPDSPTSRYVDPNGGLSLEQAVARALENEPSLRAIRGEVDAAKGARLQSGLRPNPSLSFERRDEPGGTDNLTTVSIMWPLDLFRRPGRVGVADREVTIAGLAAADRERLLAAEVRTQYGAVLANAREAAIFDEVIATIQKQHELLRARVAEGASPPLDRDVLDIELRRLRADQVMRIGRVETAMVSLKRLLGMRPDASLTVRDTLEAMVLRDSSGPSGDPPVATSASRRIDEGRADVRQAAVRVDLAEAKLDRAQREGRFDVGLFGSYMRMDSGFAQRGFGAAGELERVRGQFNYLSAGATVTLPLLNRNQGDVASAKAERASAAAALDASRLNVEAETASARLQYDRARQALSLYGDGTRTLARQNLTVVGQSYELGRVTVFDVLAEQRRYLDVENAYTDVLRAAYDARTALNLALGDVK
jgi:outer membrane protein, heavy metal efflux system